MSTYVREKVMRIPMDCEYDEMEEIENQNRSLFGYGDVGKFQIAPTEESYIDYVLEYEWDADGEYGKTRALYPREQEKYRPIWQQILPNIDMSKVRLVEFCWYNCCEAPDYYDDENDDFYKEI